MSIDLTVSRPEMYCTWLDVIGLLVTQASIGEADYSNQDIFNKVRTASQIENFITMATARVQAALTYQGYTLTGTPWGPPPIERGKDGGSRANIGNGHLIGILVNSVCNMTAVWKVEITTGGNLADARYKLYSFVEGDQGTDLHLDADNNSTNGDVTVGDNSFMLGSQNWEPGDIYYFSTLLAKKEIWYVTVTLAGAYLLNSIYTEESPNESKYGNILFNRATRFLKDIQEGKAMLIGTTIDYSPIQIPYDISGYGEDITEYADDDTDGYIG